MNETGNNTKGNGILSENIARAPPDQIYVSNLNLEISGGLGATMTGRVISLTDKLPHRESLPYI